MTVSPHIDYITERIQIAGQPINPNDMEAYLIEVIKSVKAEDLRPTYFELLMATAYYVFSRQKVDCAVIETGIGGLLDGTNVVENPSKVCVITDIGLDHTEILGNTVAQIAGQKAGIIQRGNHVVMIRQQDDVVSVIQDRVDAVGATLTILENEMTSSDDFRHRNWRLANAAVGVANSSWGVTMAQAGELPQYDPAQEANLDLFSPPGRLEVHKLLDGRTLILDGAHNPQKLAGLSRMLVQMGASDIAVVANLLKAPSSKLEDSLAVLAEFSSSLIVPNFEVMQDLGKVSVEASEFVARARSLGFSDAQVAAGPGPALQDLLHKPNKWLLVTGSLYLVAQTRSAMREAGMIDSL